MTKWAGAILALAAVMFAAPLGAQEQSRESMAVDATASQWSYQFAYEGFFDYRTDLVNGVPRPEGDKGFLQFRLVAPIAKSEKMPITLLPRLTARVIHNKDDDFGFGSSDLFILGILQEWATGRWGLGPQINFPAQENFGSKKWALGLAGAVTERKLDDRIFLAFLVQQTWRKNANDETKAQPLTMTPVFVYQLGGGAYIGNGDMNISYNYQNGSWLVPVNVRLGKAFVGPTTTWNAYVEYGTSVVYEDWQAPVPTHLVRVNVQFQIPVGL